MPGFKPARRWQPAFRPFRKEKPGRRLAAAVERAVKGPLFGCRMCGNCLLQETAFICPMECPKGMRNGPCGGTTSAKNCYVDETRKCVWYAIYLRAFATGRQERLLEVLPPVDWSRVGTDTWAEVMNRIREVGTGTFTMSLFSSDKTHKHETWENVFRIIRQPDWWNGDSVYHPPAYSGPASEFERKLQSGEFVVATEVTPPLGSLTVKLVNDLRSVKPYVSAVNFTDSSSARPKMSSVSCAAMAVSEGVDPVVQIAARDTTRTGLQATAIGLNSMGIKNVLCITGDNPSIGGQPVSSMNILDLDSVQMLWILRRMRDEGIYLDGRKIKNRPSFFLGAATSPFASDPALQALKDQKKVNAGAQFFQSNLVFEPEKLDPWLEELDKRNVLEKVHILIGVAPLKSYRVAEYLNTKVPGVRVPVSVLERMRKAGESAPEEGVRIVLEIIDGLRNRKGVNGIHIMTMGWEEIVGRIVSEAGLQNQNK